MKKIFLLFKEFWNCLINCGNVKEETGATLYASIFSFIIAMVNFFALFTFSNQLNWKMTQAIGLTWFIVLILTFMSFYMITDLAGIGKNNYFWGIVCIDCVLFGATQYLLSVFLYNHAFSMLLVSLAVTIPYYWILVGQIIKNKGERQIYFDIKKRLEGKYLQFFLFICLLCVAFFLTRWHDIEIINIIDISVLISLAIVFLSSSLIDVIHRRIQVNLEDSAKLNADNSELLRQYPLENIFEFESDKKIAISIMHLKEKDEKWTFKIDDHENKYYELPEQIKEYSKELFDSHESSNVYNSLMIRLENITIENGEVKLDTSRTFYYDLLVSNRACDYRLSNGKSIREIYEPGPYLRCLKESKLSNHLGFNGLIITKDNYVPLIIRSNKVSIGKRKLSPSIAASLKVKYVVDKKDHKFKEGMFANGIIREIGDELHLGTSKEEILKMLGVREEDVINSIFCFYRDLEECGKPQFLFCLKTDITKQELENSFYPKDDVALEEQNKKEMKKDGKDIIFLNLDDLKNVEINVQDNCTIKIYDKEYQMDVSSIGSLCLCTKYIKTE